MKVWTSRTAGSYWDVMHSGRGRCQSHAAVFTSVTKDQHLSHGSGSLKNWVDFIWESDFVDFLLFAGRLDPKADVPPRYRPSGWRVHTEQRLGVRVKFRGWRPDEGQGYGQVRVTVRAKCPTPLGQHLSGLCVQFERCHYVICSTRNTHLQPVTHNFWRQMQNICCSRAFLYYLRNVFEMLDG